VGPQLLRNTHAFISYYHHFPPIFLLPPNIFGKSMPVSVLHTVVGIAEFLYSLASKTDFFPDQEDLTGAAFALLRLQDTYALPAANIAKGLLQGITDSPRMTGILNLFSLLFGVYNLFTMNLLQFLQHYLTEHLMNNAEHPGVYIIQKVQVCVI